ncbi:MAG TPA: BadF/BadG/BcrA/BcrD ATPase family protein [Acidobacteriaceae bacterium]
MQYFLALDAGGTKTQCWVGDEKQVLGRSVSGTVKLMNVGEETATARLHEVVQKAAKSAGIELNQIARTCMGLAGISSDVVRTWAWGALSSLVSGEILLTGDEEIALDAAFGAGPGVLVIAGTGSHVVGRCTNGTRVTAGGWGPVVGDEGSGTWVGLEAIRTALRELDQGLRSGFLGEAQKHWKLESLGQLIAHVNHRKRPDFSELATVVAQCAEDGDALAIDVLERAGEELADQVSLVIDKMRACGAPPSDGSNIAFTGSVLEKIPHVLRSMEEHLTAEFPEIRVAAEAVNPLKGAMWRARQG